MSYSYESPHMHAFLFFQYLSPARPNGIALHEIITTTQIRNDSDSINLAISMEIVPSSCGYDLPLINITLLDSENTPGDLNVYIYSCHGCYSEIDQVHKT